MESYMTNVCHLFCATNQSTWKGQITVQSNVDIYHPMCSTMASTTGCCASACANRRECWKMAKANGKIRTIKTTPCCSFECGRYSGLGGVIPRFPRDRTRSLKLVHTMLLYMSVSHTLPLEHPHKISHLILFSHIDIKWYWIGYCYCCICYIALWVLPLHPSNVNRGFYLLEKIIVGLCAIFNGGWMAASGAQHWVRSKCVTWISSACDVFEWCLIYDFFTVRLFYCPFGSVFVQHCGTYATKTISKHRSNQRKPKPKMCAGFVRFQ